QGALLRTALRAPTVVRTYYGDGLRVNGLVLSPDGRTLALEDDVPNIFFIDTATGRRVAELPNVAFRGTGPPPLAFAPDGTLLTFGDGLAAHQVYFVDPSTGKVTRRLTLPPPIPTDYGGSGLAFADGGHRLAVTIGDRVVQWSLPQGRLVTTPFHVSGADGVTYTPDGRRLFVDGDGKTTVLDARTGRTLRSYAESNVESGVLSPDATALVWGDWDGSVHFVDLASGAVTTSVDAHPGGVRTVAFTPDGKRVITGGEDGVAREWDLASIKSCRPSPGTPATSSDRRSARTVRPTMRAATTEQCSPGT
ncbi:MAG TPA: PQQ-binding-like beta-propeller repeat protein, partial [Mycobacterium sp.]|nr:PQQ-binding-like beta-propeller repeat protein [Mycobacterium sp.]